MNYISAAANTTIFLTEFTNDSTSGKTVNFNKNNLGFNNWGDWLWIERNRHLYSNNVVIRFWWYQYIWFHFYDSISDSIYTRHCFKHYLWWPLLLFVSTCITCCHAQFFGVISTLIQNIFESVTINRLQIFFFSLWIENSSISSSRVFTLVLRWISSLSHDSQQRGQKTIPHFIARAESVTKKLSIKKGIVKILQNSLGNTCVGAPLQIMLQTVNLQPVIYAGVLKTSNLNNILEWLIL